MVRTLRLSRWAFFWMGRDGRVHLEDHGFIRMAGSLPATHFLRPLRRAVRVVGFVSQAGAWGYRLLPAEAGLVRSRLRRIWVMDIGVGSDLCWSNARKTALKAQAQAE